MSAFSMLYIYQRERDGTEGEELSNAKSPTVGHKSAQRGWVKCCNDGAKPRLYIVTSSAISLRLFGIAIFFCYFADSIVARCQYLRPLSTTLNMNLGGDVLVDVDHESWSQGRREGVSMVNKTRRINVNVVYDLWWLYTSPDLLIPSTIAGDEGNKPNYIVERGDIVRSVPTPLSYPSIVIKRALNCCRKGETSW